MFERRFYRDNGFKKPGARNELDLHKVRVVAWSIGAIVAATAAIFASSANFEWLMAAAVTSVLLARDPKHKE